MTFDLTPLLLRQLLRLGTNIGFERTTISLTISLNLNPHLVPLLILLTSIIQHLIYGLVHAFSVHREIVTSRVDVGDWFRQDRGRTVRILTNLSIVLAFVHGEFDELLP